MDRPRKISLLTSVLSLLAQGVLAAQAPSLETRQIGDRVSCRRCEIQLERLATLRDSAGEARFVALPMPSVARTTFGKFVAGTLSGAPLAIFNSDGSLDATFGRFGSGPEEFFDLDMIIRIDDQDTVHVFQYNRHTVVTPGFTEIVRSRLLRLRARDAIVMDGRPLVQATVHEPQGRSTPVQLLSHEGRTIRGLGRREDRPITAGSQWDAFRRIAPATAPGRLWVAYVNRFEISQFDLEGNEHFRVVRDAEWFPPYQEDRRVGEGWTIPPRPRVNAVVQSTPRLLWVSVTVADPQFESVGSGTGEARLDPYEPHNRRLDTILEVLDLTTGAVLARHRSDQYLNPVQDPTGAVLWYGLRQLDSGELAADVWRATLSR